MPEDRNSAGGAEIPVVYANVANVTLGTFDLSFQFGRKKDREVALSDEDFDVEIVMSPQHAKVFSKILQDNIEKYEAVFGAVQVDVSDERVKELESQGIVVKKVGNEEPR